MSEENKNNMDQDLIFRSILEEGMEPAPAHVWDRIEEDLDRIARRRMVMLRFRRTAAGVAAAAILALGMFMDWGTEKDLVSPAAGEGMIAVVEQVEEPASTSVEETEEKVPDLLTMAAKPAITHRSAKEETGISEGPVTIPAATSEEETYGPVVTEPEKPRKTKDTYTYDNSDRFPDVWTEEERKYDRNRISFVLSGLTGTNSAQNGTRVNPVRRPGISAAPKKTGIKETSTNTTYGIPVSVGAGVRIEFAPRWSVGAGLNYTLLTRKFYGTYNFVSEQGKLLRDVSSDIRNSQHYIGIPVNIYYDIVDRKDVHFYAYAGSTADKCISDRYQVLGTDITHTEKVKGMQFSANLGLGAEFIAGEHIGIYFDPNLKYYFDNRQPKSIRTAKPLMFGFEVGLRFHL